MENRRLSRRMKSAVYALKRAFGGGIQLYRQGTPTTDLETGQKVVTGRSSIDIARAIILPETAMRKTQQGVAFIAANKNTAFGGSFDKGKRFFYIDPSDLPPNYVIAQDDWVGYDARKYEISKLTWYEFDGLWEIEGSEIIGHTHLVTENVGAYHVLNITHSADVEVN